MPEIQAESEHRNLTILLVEDDNAHARLVKRSLENHPAASEIRHVENGEAALDYLFENGEFSGANAGPRPDLILLDLRLPRKDGLEVLGKIKTTDSLKTIPVVVLTTSTAESDVRGAYERHANSYLVKPFGLEGFSELLRELGLYWLQRNLLLRSVN